jgi:hypothetical protein
VGEAKKKKKQPETTPYLLEKAKREDERNST